MSRRPGLTLTEVLVTLAILAFGILAILTLFPLAASQMAVAVREDRSAQAANAADGYIRAYWKSEVVENVANSLPVTEPFYSALLDPNAGVTPPHGTFTPAAAGEPSYPVVLDPMGYASRGPVAGSWMGDGGVSNAPRRSLSRITSVGGTQYPFRVCSLMDGMGYDENGHPTTDRELRYNWAWMIQCPDAGTRTTANLTVVVYDNRPNLYAPTGSETIHTATVTPKSTQVILSGSVNVKPGGWIMDVTDPTVNTATNKIRHGIPYQVVSVVDGGSTTTLELQTPLQKPNDPLWTPATYNAKFVVMRGVTGVYPRAPLTAN
ncbi:unnamed protein product [Gemmataceae bacterium]|nr:unnamed protein product [Gemmataceae bacterium]VTU00477.1 unnamed protein product [Gemmataceae bacterium]